MIIVDVNGNKRECIRVYPDELWPGYMKVEYVSKNRSGQKHQEWYPKQEFVKNNPDLAKFAKGTPDVWKEDLGAVSHASAQTLTDKTKKWETNEFAGYPVWISRGLGEGQTRSIMMNSGDTLILNESWEVTPDKSSQYLISHNVHNPQVMGNTLPLAKSAIRKPKKERKKKK